MAVLRRGGGRLHRRREVKKRAQAMAEPSGERAPKCTPEAAVVLVTHAPHGGALVAWVVRVRGWG